MYMYSVNIVFVMVTVPSAPPPLQYLRETLTAFIIQLLETDEDCEVDPSKLSPTAVLHNNQQVLTRLIKRVWFDILTSWTRFPRCVS